MEFMPLIILLPSFHLLENPASLEIAFYYSPSIPLV
jgi:hypothetical protein